MFATQINPRTIVSYIEFYDYEQTVEYNVNREYLTSNICLFLRHGPRSKYGTIVTGFVCVFSRPARYFRRARKNLIKNALVSREQRPFELNVNGQSSR